MPTDLTAAEREALDPFRRALAVIDALPPEYRSDEHSLRSHLPGVWPTVGDLRRLLSQAATAPPVAFPFPYNPAHKIGTCGNCGGEMTYNVPRMGPDGGFIHANGSLLCPATPDPATVPGMPLPGWVYEGTNGWRYIGHQTASGGTSEAQAASRGGEG